MSRVEIQKSTGINGPKVEILARPPRRNIPLLLISGALLCWALESRLPSLSSIFSLKMAVVAFVLVLLNVFLTRSAVPANRATLEDGYLFIQQRFFGIKSVKKFRLSGISNLSYRRRPWYGSGKVPQPSVQFSASEELGVSQGLGAGLMEEDANVIIRCIEEYRALIGADSSASGLRTDSPQSKIAAANPRNA
jgi:hypothetical protein